MARQTIPIEQQLAFDVEDACALIKVSRPTLYTLIEDGLLPSYMIGTRRYFRRAHIETCLDHLEKQSPLSPSKGACNNRNGRRGSPGPSVKVTKREIDAAGKQRAK